LFESLGISLGALSVALLVRGMDDRNGYVAAAGLGAMALGMSARAGAIFALPCILLVVFIGPALFRSTGWKAVVVAVVLSAGGLSWTALLNRTYGTGSGAAGANFAYTAAGLAMGGTWAD